MPDYKTMYFKLFRATEQAARLLIAAQQECEELFLEEQGPPLALVPQEMQENAEKK